MAFTERLALIISAKADQALREIKKVGASAGDLGKKFTGAAQVAGEFGATLKAFVAAGAAAGAAALAGLAAASIQAASSLSEQISATGQVFGDASAKVIAFGKTAAEAFGVSNRAALQASNQFGDLFTNVGVSEKNAATFSTQLVRLASDIASFKDLAPGDVLQGLSSGLVGETEPLRRFGIVINEAAVKAKAMELGIAGANGEVSEGAKVQARYALILESTSKAQGDFARTSDSLANRQRALNAQFEDTQAKLGEKLIPIAADATAVFTDVVDAAVDIGPAVAKGFPGLEFAGKTLGKVLDILAGDTRQAAEGYEQLDAATAKQAKITEDAARVQRARSQGLKEAAKATDAYTDATRSLANASQGLSDSRFHLEGAELALSDAHADVADKERALADAHAGLGSRAKAAADATRALADANRDASRSAEDSAEAVADAQRDVDKQLGLGGGGFDSAVERLQDAQRNQARAAEDSARRIADAAKAQAEAQKEGGQAADVAAAQKALSDSRRQETETANSLAKARRDLALQEQELVKLHAQVTAAAIKTDLATLTAAAAAAAAPKPGAPGTVTLESGAVQIFAGAATDAYVQAQIKAAVTQGVRAALDPFKGGR